MSTAKEPRGEAHDGFNIAVFSPPVIAILEES
jgi:hypothetical protein